jgi:hypothetical protein
LAWRHEGSERIKAAYGANYERLVAVKNKYDPTNLRHQNIKPTIIGGVRATLQIRNDFVFLADALLSACAQSFACNRTVDGEKL